MAKWEPIEPLEIDFEAYGRERAGYERALLDMVRTHPRKATAAEAAIELLRWYAHFGQMHDEEVQRVIVKGQRAVMLNLTGAVLNGSRARETKPLDYFDRCIKESKGGGQKVTGVKGYFLQMRAAFGDYMSREEAMKVLASDGDTSKPIPATMRGVEKALTDYLRGAYGDVADEVLHEFVHASFPELPWGKPKTEVRMSRDWLTCAS